MDKNGELGGRDLDSQMLNFLKKKTHFFSIQSFLGDHLRQLEEKKQLIPRDVYDVTKYSLEEILGIFKSMDILISKDDYAGCTKLSRSILENSINLQYIYKEDTEKRAKNFKLAALKGIAKRFESLNEPTPEAKEMYGIFTEPLKEYEPEVNIREKFKAVNSESRYLRSYTRLSEHVHPVYRPSKLNYDENRPYILEMKRTVRSDTCLVTLMALERVCTRYDLDGGVFIIDDPEYKAVLLFATNPKKQEEKDRIGN